MMVVKKNADDRVLIISVLLVEFMEMDFLHFQSGAGRIRTAVQTSNRYAFYMLILCLIVGVTLDTSTQGCP